MPLVERSVYKASATILSADGDREAIASLDAEQDPQQSNFFLHRLQGTAGSRCIDSATCRLSLYHSCFASAPAEFD